MNPGRSLRACTCALLMALGGIAPLAACSVPVFRYALERWPADHFTVQVLHADTATAEDWAQRLDERSVGEGRFFNATYVPLTSDDSASAPAGDEPPLLQLHYPEVYRMPDVLWSAPASDTAAAQLIESPARREAARRILGGDSIVWLFIRSGDDQADTQARTQLNETLERLQTEIPAPDITAEDQDIHMESDLELAIRFTILEIDHDDADEAVLLACLRGGFPPLDLHDGPVAVPLYGRGRTLPSMLTGPIEPDFIEEASWYLTGACSCEIKRQNPGIDLPFAVDWDAFLYDTFVVDKDLPPLAGMASTTIDDHVRAEAVVAAMQPDTASDTATAALTALPSEAPRTSDADWLRIAVIVVGAVVVLVMGGTTILVMRGRREP